ncbi:hypothetical protein GOV13_02750 [Candidatus Pacearchaeota archaeon]|nr:hypothetical protein [Candidatus Pacearchaeota archaeon]
MFSVLYTLTVAKDLTSKPRANPTVMKPTTMNAVAPISALIDWLITFATITKTITPTTKAIPALIKSAIVKYYLLFLLFILSCRGFDVLVGGCFGLCSCF